MLSFFLQLLVTGLATGSIYALVALGFGIVFHTTKILNFAHGEFVMIGALVGYTVCVSLQWPFLVAVFAAGAVSMAVGIATERFAVRPVLKLQTSIGWIMSTMGASIVMKNAAMLIWGREPLPFPSIFGEQSLKLLGVSTTPQELYTFAVAVALLIIVDRLQEQTIIGKALKAVAHDNLAATLVGINTRTMIILSFAVSAGLAAMAGLLISPVTYASSQMGTMLGLMGFSAAVLGGLGSPAGALAGGLLLGVSESMARGYAGAWLHDTVAFFVLIIVLFIRPAGLFGKRQVKKV